MFKGYNIIETLHQGIKSNVYRANSIEGNKTVVIKALANPYPKPLEIGRLRHEFQLLESLGIKGVPEAICFEKSDNYYGIVLEDHKGIPAKLYLNNQGPDLSYFLDIAIQLCQIISGLHSKQIIHKDIKPSNIIVSPATGQAELIDFGLSVRLLSGTQESSGIGILEGSLPYISPEQTGRMNRPVDCRSDLYSLGVTFFELVTGRLPFIADHPLEWVHAHLAQKPPDPRAFRADLPEAIAVIILKLLSKTSEDRYQSAYSLQTDLENCEVQWKEKKSITTFELAAANTFGLYVTPSNLYGRQEQLQQLSEILNSVAEGSNTQLIMVSGYSGIGKTAYVQEARKQITIAKGNFTSGKFDQLNKGLPYSGFILAFTELAQQLLTEKEEDLQNIKAQLLEALGGNAQIINQLIPAFELIIGTHPSPPSLLPEETSNRFLQTLKTFVKTLARPGRPLIIFLDDLHWADIASLSLLELLALDHELQSLGLIGSYRSNEVDISHPLVQSLNKIRSFIPFHEIQLGNLKLNDVRSLLSDAFKGPEQETDGLAKLLLAKTEGNPFFLTQSLRNLYDEGQIYFDPGNGRWNWNEAELGSMNISDNVVEFMVSKIQKLSANAQQCLKLAACIGNEFSLKLLAGVSQPDVLSGLNQALEQGLISSLDENYVLLSDEQHFQDNFYSDDKITLSAPDARFKFLHDRVQQAAYSLLSDEESKKIHLQLGQNIISSSNENKIKEQIFIICNHLNTARELISDAKARTDLAKLNLDASKKAADATAYPQALEYSATGISLLPGNARQEAYQLWKELNHIFAQCNYLLGDMQSAEKDYSQLLSNSQSRFDKLLVYRALVNMYASGNLPSKVIETVGAALLLFKVKIPETPLAYKLRIIASIAEIKWALRNKTTEDVLQSPRSENEDHIKLAELLVESGPSLYLANQDLFAWQVLFQVRHALKLGNTHTTALAFTGYGMIMNAAFGDIDLAGKMADLGEKLNHAMGNPYTYCRLKYIIHNFISHHKSDIRTYFNDFQALAKMALAGGDYLYLGMNYSNIILYNAALGQGLAELIHETDINLNHLLQLKNDYNYEMIVCRLQSLLLLTGKKTMSWKIDKPNITIEEEISLLKNELAFTHLCIMYTSLYEINYLLNLEEDNLVNRLLDSETYLNFIIGIYSFIDFALFQSLCFYKVFHSQTPDTRSKFKKIIKDHLKILKRRSVTCDANYGSYYRLISAIYLLISNKENEGLQLLENIIPECQNRELTHLSAIVKELIGQIYLKRNKEKIASVYLKESAYDFNRWGAIAKVKLMIGQYPFLELNKDYNFSENDEEIRSDTIITESQHGLDLSSLMKSATTISGEIILNKLLPSMISIVVENAGAQVGYLVLENNNNLVLSVKRNVSNPDAEFMHELPVNECVEVAQAVIKYAYRTQDIVILENAYSDERFKNDEHIRKNKLKSILCIPIIHKGAFRGALYLENNLVTHAFSEERVNVMKILSSQIAISLDNALLYHNLEDALGRQVTLTEAYSRFTPKEYLRFLGHTSILDVKLGDHRIETMTVLFSDIRSYTTIAEQFTAEENFKFLSAYLEKMTEIITAHNGMVNQLLGDGILAFFNETDDALRAAIEMQTLLQNYRVERKNGEPIRIKAGIGLHSGEVIIGIVGNAQSMATGIVSDTVNSAARIEGLTKHFGVNILLSETVVKQLKTGTCDQLRFIASVIMKGKKQGLGVYECFDGDNPEIKIKKLQSLNEYHQAVNLYSSKYFRQASDKFTQLFQNNNSDTLLHYYLGKSESMINKVIPEDWNATEVMDFK